MIDLVKKKRLIPVIAAALLLISLCACVGGNGQAETSAPPPASPSQNETPDAQSTPDTSPATEHQTDAPASPDDPFIVTGEVVISFDYEKQSGAASNQWAVWVEDMDGNYINTLYATQWTANGGYKSRPDSIALWVEKSGIATMPDYYVDAISGATPKSSGSQSYTWNLKDINGDTVSIGEYRIFVEGTLRWKNYVLHSGVIEIGDQPVTVQANAAFTYEGSDRYAALTGNSPENNMIGPVTASFTN